MDGPYDWPDDLPMEAVRTANRMDTAGDLPDDERVPIGADTRFEATVHLLSDLEKRRGIDVLQLLLEIEHATLLSDEDVQRAIRREEKLVRSNENDDRRGGRPSKVDEVSRSILATISACEKGKFDKNRPDFSRDPEDARDTIIWEKLYDADISESTYYRIRKKVRNEVGFDVAEIDGVPGKIGL